MTEQGHYAKKHPEYKKALRIEKKARPQRQVDALDNEWDEPGFMDGRKQLAAESVKKKVTNEVIFLANSNALSNQPITPPRSQVEELLQLRTIVKISKLPPKWIRKIQNRMA